jgi:cytochrome c556
MEMIAMKRVAALTITLAFCAITNAAAQDASIKARQEVMKNNGEALKQVSRMIKGETPLDPEAAAASMKSIADSVDNFLTLFPEGSTSGSDASPEIWRNLADFNAKGVTTKQAAEKATSATMASDETFRAAFTELSQACKACHEKYRVER